MIRKEMFSPAQLSLSVSSFAYAIEHMTYRAQGWPRPSQIQTLAAIKVASQQTGVKSLVSVGHGGEILFLLRIFL